MKRYPSSVSYIAIAEAEYEAGLRSKKPRCWHNTCKAKRCPGVEIIMMDGMYCPMWAGDDCPHVQHYRRCGLEPDLLNPPLIREEV